MHTYDTHNHPTDPSAHVDKYATHHAIAHIHTHTHTHTYSHIYHIISYHRVICTHSLTHSLSLDTHSCLLGFWFIYLNYRQQLYIR
jgi:hypothetical protein